MLVSFTDAVGTGQQAISQATSAVPARSLQHVLIDGMPTEDQVLTANTSLVNDPQGLGLSATSGCATTRPSLAPPSVNYTLGDADVGQQIKVRVSYTDGAGNPEVLTSAATAPVANINDAPAAAIGLSNIDAQLGQSQTRRSG